MESCAQKKAYKAKDYKSDLKPIWCPGCGDYTVLNSITHALAELAIPPEEVAVVSGITAAPLRRGGFFGLSFTRIGSSIKLL